MGLLCQHPISYTIEQNSCHSAFAATISMSAVMRSALSRCFCTASITPRLDFRIPACAWVNSIKSSLSNTRSNSIPNPSTCFLYFMHLYRRVVLLNGHFRKGRKWKRKRTRLRLSTVREYSLYCRDKHTHASIFNPAWSKKPPFRATTDAAISSSFRPNPADIFSSSFTWVNTCMYEYMKST